MATKRSETKALIKAFSECDEKTRRVVEGLCRRAEFLAARLDELEADIKANGMTEMQLAPNMVEPKPIKRAQVDIYNGFVKNYTTAIKELRCALPKGTVVEESDGFDEFVAGRES